MHEETERMIVARSKFWLAIAMLFLTAASGAAQTREKVRVALGSVSVSSSLFPIAQQVGIFPRYGIDM